MRQSQLPTSCAFRYTTTPSLQLHITQRTCSAGEALYTMVAKPRATSPPLGDVPSSSREARGAVLCPFTCMTLWLSEPRGNGWVSSSGKSA